MRRTIKTFFDQFLLNMKRDILGLKEFKDKFDFKTF